MNWTDFCWWEGIHKMLKKSIHVIAVLILVTLLECLFPPQNVEASQDWWDINYQFRRQITVLTDINTPYNGYAGYTVEMTMNTISPDIQDDGDDLRIVWWDGSGWQELDRHIIDPDTASTIIRFRLQADIAASSSDDNYYVYYGNAAVGTGPANLENVYLHYNNYSTDRSGEYYIGRLGITNWHGDGNYSPPYDAGNQRISYNTGDNFVGEWVVADIDERDVYVEYQIRDSGTYPTNTTPGLLARVQWATPGSSINDFYTASFAQGSYNEAGIGRNSRNALTSAYDPTGTKYYSNNTIYRFYFAVWGINDTRFKSDFVSDSGQLQWKPGETPYVNSSSTEASDLESSGPVGFLVAQQIGWMDEFMVRRYIEPEPTLSLAAEEAVTPPTVTTNDAGNIELDSARLNGSLDDLGSATSVDVSFEWGQTPGGPYPHETTPQAMSATGAFSFDLTPLIPNTTYYFRARAAGDGTSYGIEKNFTTLTPPAVTTNDAGNIELDSARLNGSLDDLGSATSVDVSFEWGQTPGGPYPHETTPQAMSATGAFSFDLTPLIPNTTYYFRARAAGDGTSYGIEKNFTTLTPPTVILLPYEEDDDDKPRHYYLDVNALELKKRFHIDVNGRLLETVDIICADGVLNIYIPEGTVVKDSNGIRLRTLEIDVIEIPSTSTDDMYFIGPAYILPPGGTTFNPSMTLTWSYEPYTLPKGAHEEDLFLASYDENAGGWVKLDCIVDVVNHTITAEFSKSMTFAALGLVPRPAPPTVNDLTESPVGNVAGLSGSFMAEGVVPNPTQPPASPNPPAPKISSWLLIIGITVAVGVIGVALYLFISNRRKA